MPRTRGSRWLAVAVILALAAVTFIAQLPGHAALGRDTAVNMRPVPRERRGTTLGMLKAGSRVLILGMQMVPDPAGLIDQPATMVEIRADCGDLKAMHGWIDLTAFSNDEALRLFRKYRPWTR